MDPLKRSYGFEEVVKGLSKAEAVYEVKHCFSCGNCFECDGCYGACPEQAIIKLGPEEVIKYLLVGADAVMTTSALLRHGPAYVNQLVEGLKYWMELRSFSSVAQMKGTMSRNRVANPCAFERANYIKGFGKL